MPAVAGAWAVKIAVAGLGLALWAATPAEATPKNLQGKTIKFSFTTAVSGGGTCVNRSSIRFAKDQLFYSQEFISCGGSGDELPKGYGVVVPVNGSGAIKNSCKSDYGDRVERCTDGFIRKRDGRMRARETWSGSKSSKVTEGRVEVSQRMNMVGSWSNRDGQGGSYNVNVDVTLTISVSGKSCQVTGYRQRTSGSSPFSSNLVSAQKCSISG